MAWTCLCCCYLVHNVFTEFLDRLGTLWFVLGLHDGCSYRIVSCIIGDNRIYLASDCISIDLPRDRVRGWALGARVRNVMARLYDITIPPLSARSIPARQSSYNHITSYHTRRMPSVQIAKSNDNGQHPKLKKYKYKHTLRKSPYFVSLVFLLIATVLTILNIYVS